MKKAARDLPSGPGIGAASSTGCATPLIAIGFRPRAVGALERARTRRLVHHADKWVDNNECGSLHFTSLLATGSYSNGQAGPLCEFAQAGFFIGHRGPRESAFGDARPHVSHPRGNGCRSHGSDRDSLGPAITEAAPYESLFSPKPAFCEQRLPSQPLPSTHRRCRSRRPTRDQGPLASTERRHSSSAPRFARSLGSDRPRPRNPGKH